MGGERRGAVRLRAGGAAGVLPAIAAGGGSPERALAEASLTRAEIADPDRLVDLGKILALFEAGARETGDELFGARVGASYDVGALGSLAYAVLNAPTIEQALRNFDRYAHTHIQAARILVTRDGAVCRVDVGIPESPGALRRQAIDCSLVVVVGLVRRLIAPSWRPRVVRVGHPAPADPVAYERLVGAPVRFGEPVEAAFELDAEDLAREVIGADRQLLPIVQQHLDAMTPACGGGDGWLRELRSLVAKVVCDGHPAIEKLAPRVGMSPRTVQRRLGAHGLSWKRLVEEVRRELASRYLEGPTPLTEIAFLLGYSELSAFDRAFRRWTGTTPMQLRRRAQAAAG